MLVEWLNEAPGGTNFFYCWDCTEDILLISEVTVVAGGIVGGLATGALGLSRSECYILESLLLSSFMYFSFSFKSKIILLVEPCPFFVIKDKKSSPQSEL
jgi:hypothetical protein